MPSSSNSLSNKLFKMLKGISRRSREIFILKIRSWPKKLWVRDIHSTTIREKSNHSMVRRRSNKEISSSNKAPLINTNKEVSPNKRKSKSSKRRSRFSKSLSSKLFMILRRRKSCLNSIMSKLSRTREKISKTWEKVSDKRTRNLRISGLSHKSWLTKDRRLSSSSLRLWNKSKRKLERKLPLRGNRKRTSSED